MVLNQGSTAVFRIITTSQNLARWAKILYEGNAMPENYFKELLTEVPINKDGAFYGLEVVINKKDPLGTILGHYGVIPGYTSSMQYLPQFKLAIAFQINTDIGVFDRSTTLLHDMEKRLARAVVKKQID